MDKAHELKQVSAGEAAVEGLLNGMLAGIAMALVLLAVEFVGGVPPLAVLGYFDAGGSASPWVGAFTHLAVSGIYGVIFGLLAATARRMRGVPVAMVWWLVAGAVYGLIILAVAQWMVLPRTALPLTGVSPALFALAHLVYGLALAWLTARKQAA